MTTARDVIAKLFCDAAGPNCDCGGGKLPCIFYKGADAILSAPEPVRLELAALLNPWRPIETAPKDEMFIYYWPRDGKRCIGLAYRTVSGDWRDSEGNWHIRLEPTHWLPLPAPPSPL